MRSRKQLFSIRMGYRKEAPPQVNRLDKNARNAFYFFFIDSMHGTEYFNSLLFIKHSWHITWSNFCSRFLKLSREQIFTFNEKKINSQTRTKIESIFFRKSWFFSLDAIEWLAQERFGDFNKENSEQVRFHSTVNTILNDHNIGYAFIEGKFLPLSNKEESATVQIAAGSPLEKVKGHIGKAIDSLDRNKPDYANCIKESISAVEGILSEITGESELSKACAWLQKQKAPLHPQFIQAIKNLYTFTCDEGGIRHAIKDKKQQEIDQEAAVCMLVTCSAIANYLAAKIPQLKKDESGKAADDDNIPF